MDVCYRNKCRQRVLRIPAPGGGAPNILTGVLGSVISDYGRGSTGKRETTRHHNRKGQAVAQQTLTCAASRHLMPFLRQLWQECANQSVKNERFPFVDVQIFVRGVRILELRRASEQPILPCAR